MGAMGDVYADVGRCATTIALRLGRFAEGKRIEKDRLALCPVRDELRRMSKGEVQTDPDKRDPIFTTIEGQVVVIFAAREELHSEDRAAVMRHLASRSEMLDRVLSESTLNGVADAKALDDFFGDIDCLCHLVI